MSVKAIPTPSFADGGLRFSECSSFPSARPATVLDGAIGEESWAPSGLGCPVGGTPLEVAEEVS